MPRKTENLERARPGSPEPSMRPRPDAAENPSGSARGASICGSFNEAAARCRGKPAAGTWTTTRSPRPFNEAAARCRGKPRKPDEDDTGGQVPSMRPRPDAAENRAAAGRAATARAAFNEAAARCRGKPAEGAAVRGGADEPFNEAAARCRGKPHAPEDEVSHALAPSMRPRPDAAENRAGRSRPRRRRRPFNEAAARCRGKPSRKSSSGGGTRTFNEAAARCRGKPKAEGAAVTDVTILQ